MTSIRSEYKLGIFILIAFLVLLSGYLIHTNFIAEKVSEFSIKSNYIKCNDTTITNGITYINHYCQINDDNGNNYVISYPELDSNNELAKKLNVELKNKYKDVYSKISYAKNDENYTIKNYESLTYQLYYSNGIISIVTDNKNVDSDNYVTSVKHIINNIDSTTYQTMTEDNMKEKLNINRDFVSNLRAYIIKIYNDDFNYFYYDADRLENELIDTSIKNVVYSNLNNIYIDNNGNYHFIMKLYRPDRIEPVDYYFQVDSKEKITYELKEY